MGEIIRIQLDVANCIIQPDRMTITPKWRKGNEVIVDRLTQEIMSRDFFFGITVSSKRRILFDDVIRVLGKRIQCQDFLPLGCRLGPSPFFYQVFITTRQGHTYAFTRIIEGSNADARALNDRKYWYRNYEDGWVFLRNLILYGIDFCVNGAI